MQAFKIIEENQSEINEEENEKVLQCLREAL